MENNTNLNPELNEAFEAAEDIVLDTMPDVSFMKKLGVATGAAVVVGGLVFLTTKYGVPTIKKWFHKDAYDAVIDVEPEAERTEKTEG